MTPQDFIRKWKPVALTERSAAQQHFLDLCAVFEHPTPAEDDPTGERFTFEKGVVKTGGGDGFADVWKKGFFAWEYKKKKRDLGAALEQLTRYAAALENPPLHVACDTHLFRIETRWTNEVPAKHQFELEDLAEPQNLAILQAVFHNPEKLRSGRTRAVLTKEAAEKFQTISDSLQHRNADREAVAHFVNQLVFCFFADSVGLLPKGLWRKLLESSARKPDKSKEWLDRLFADMKDGGDFNLEDIAQFNGGLFDGRGALRLEHTEIGLLFAAASLDWSLIDPTIFGTLFERFLDPDKRAQIGAHYTDPDKIMMIVEPVVARPLRREWGEAKARIEATMAPVLAAEANTKNLSKKFEAARAKAEAERDAFIDRLCALRILDPACGSGNFLYLALQAVKDIEYAAILECETLGLGMVVPRVGPEILHGIEINPFAAELARTTIWIGDIQWRVKNAITHHPRPILRKLDAIECRDALLTPDGKEAEWPEADYIVGNPPFLGGKLLRGGRSAKYKTVGGQRVLSEAAHPGLGDDYVDKLFAAYKGRISAESDLVCYWFFKSRNALLKFPSASFGLVATNSIRGGANREELEAITENGRIFEAWSDEPWLIDGASVRVSLVCAEIASTANSDSIVSGDVSAARLNGTIVDKINADLRADSVNLLEANELQSNKNLMAQGIKFGGPYEITEQEALEMLAAPINPNDRPNSDVIATWINGNDILKRPPRQWCIDFGTDRSHEEATLYEVPYEKLRHAFDEENTRRAKDGERPLREREPEKARKWWIHQRARDSLRVRISGLPAWIANCEVAKHRIVTLVDSSFLPSGSVYVIARGDYTTFGILHSRFHEAWSLRLGTSLEDRPRYTPTTTFETFPFPEGLTPNIPAAHYADDPRAQRIAAAAKRLDDLRRAWLNPPDLVDVVPEIVPTAAPGEEPRRYPDRILPKNADAAVKLKERTLTNLYNQRPRWLADAHETLDRAVAAAYGWPEDISTEDALKRLLALNLERAGAPLPPSS